MAIFWLICYKKELENRNNIDGEYLSKVIGVIHSKKLTKKQIRDWFSEYAGLHHIKITIQGIGYLISEGDFQYLICEEVASPYSAIKYLMYHGQDC